MKYASGYASARQNSVARPAKTNERTNCGQ